MPLCHPPCADLCGKGCVLKGLVGGGTLGINWDCVFQWPRWWGCSHFSIAASPTRPSSSRDFHSQRTLFSLFLLGEPAAAAVLLLGGPHGFQERWEGSAETGVCGCLSEPFDIHFLELTPGDALLHFDGTRRPREGTTQERALPQDDGGCVLLGFVLPDIFIGPEGLYTSYSG